MGADCRHVSTYEHESFESTQAWNSYYKNNFGIHGTGSYNGFSATLSASVGSSSSSNWTDDKQSVFYRLYNRRMCYELQTTCLSNSSYLLPDIKTVIASLSATGSDEGTMQQWVKNFIYQFGSHVNVASQHGAEIKFLSSIDKQCQYSSDCLQSKACADLSFMKFTSPSLCDQSSGCNLQNDCNDMKTTNCVLVGGDPSTVATTLCSSSVSATDVDTFLNSGDPTSGTTAIQYSFEQISDVLRYMNYVNEADTLDKAIEYHACTQPRYSWQVGDNGDHSCKCTLQCENGASLDTDSCTCQCRGDATHGWKGSTCASMYGHCEDGTGNGNTNYGKNCQNDNQCASWYNSYTCGPTEVCCMSDVDGKCCPFGSSCSCPFLESNCECESGDSFSNSTVKLMSISV